MPAVFVGTGAPLLSGTGLTSEVQTVPAGETVDTSYELIPSAAQRHIIKRPRLTRLLASAKGRILMLVAPAGFGKTTLAREWVADKPHAWYRGTTATADVAALAAGLSDSLRAIVPGAGERMIQRMRATGTPEQDVQPLAELLSEDLTGWPDDAWLVVDDYQFAMDSDASEQFVDMVVRLSPLRVLIASRNRPTWATARRLLYGEIYEVGRNELAMTQDEAAEVLAETRDDAAPGLVALTEGWPAVVGLAALTRDFELPDGSLPDALYDYFAEELYQAASAATQRGLTQLALVDAVTAELPQFLLGTAADSVLEESARLGFLSSVSETPELHPLLRSFLRRKSGSAGPQTSEAVRAVIQFLAAREMWDEALLLIERFEQLDIFLQVLEAALPSLVGEARLPTLARCLELAEQWKLDDPAIDLADAELAFRQADRRRALALAQHAASRIDQGHALYPRALLLAGRSAHLEGEDADALNHYFAARKVAKTREEAMEAAVGLAQAALNVDDPQADAYLNEVRSLDDGSADSHLRRVSSEALAATRSESLRPMLATLEVVEPFLNRASNPLAHSSTLNMHAYLLALAGRYEEAADTAVRSERYARQEKLDFVTPHARRVQAMAAIGLRQFPRARQLVDWLEDSSNVARDAFTHAEACMLRARLLSAQGFHVDALKALSPPHISFPFVAEEAEFMAIKGLMYAHLGDVERALAKADESVLIGKSGEAHAFAAWTRAVCAARRSADLELVRTAASSACVGAFFDAMVVAYRGTPALLQRLIEVPEWSQLLEPVVLAARDTELLRELGVVVERPRGAHLLSPREREIHVLLSQGLTNKRIAQALFISEATVKAHVHRILEKLNVRSRTEAAVRLIDD